jgi:transcriptional regulator with XRE-family HTH domain
MMDIDAHIATQIKSLRAAHGWTLEQLAQASGVSRGMISKIERGEASATAALLSRLALALQVPLSDLLAPARVATSISRKSERPRWQDPATGFVRETVSPPATGSSVEIVEVELPPQARVDYQLDGPATHTQHVLVLAGSLRVRQEATVELQPGDALYMTPVGEFGFDNPGTQPCRYLVVMERPRRTP